MSLARKDVRVWLDADIHEAVAGEASDDGMKLGEWVEQLILRELKRRDETYAEAIRRYERLQRLGISRSVPEKPGQRRNGTDNGGGRR